MIYKSYEQFELKYFDKKQHDKYLKFLTSAERH